MTKTIPLQALLSDAREKGNFLLVHGKTESGCLASMSLGRCFQSEPEILLLDFSPETAKEQIREILNILVQSFDTPTKLEDVEGKTFYCSVMTFKDWFQSDHQVKEVVEALTQSIPFERLPDFLGLSSVCIISSSELEVNIQ